MTTLTRAEMDFCFYKKGTSGSFTKGLIELIFKADDENRAKLAQGFPELVEVVNRFNRENGYWANVVKRWNESYPHSSLAE